MLSSYTYLFHVQACICAEFKFSFFLRQCICLYEVVFKGVISQGNTLDSLIINVLMAFWFVCVFFLSTLMNLHDNAPKAERFPLELGVAWYFHGRGYSVWRTFQCVGANQFTNGEGLLGRFPAVVISSLSEGLPNISSNFFFKYS